MGPVTNLEEMEAAEAAEAATPQPEEILVYVALLKKSGAFVEAIYRNVVVEAVE